MYELDPLTLQDHCANRPMQTLLLGRFFSLLNNHNPDLMSTGSKSYKIPPPQCLREGNKKTIFANIAEICKRMNRTDEHVTQFLFAELGTSGSVDGNRRLVIKGKVQPSALGNLTLNSVKSSYQFLQKQIENVLRRYISKLLSRSPEDLSHKLHLGNSMLTLPTVEYVTWLVIYIYMRFPSHRRR